MAASETIRQRKASARWKVAIAVVLAAMVGGVAVQTAFAEDPPVEIVSVQVGYRGLFKVGSGRRSRSR